MDPNLLNQLLGLLNRHTQSVAASSQQPTDATTYLRHRQFVDGSSGPSNAVQGLQSGINSAPFTGNPYGNTPLFMTGLSPEGSSSSWGDFLQQQLQQLSTTANYQTGKPSVPPTLPAYDPNAGPYGGFFPSSTYSKPSTSYSPYNPYGGDWINPQYPGGYGSDVRNPPPFTQPASSKWVLGPGGGTYYNDELQRYNGYVPPTPTGKWSVRPMNPQFIRDPYSGSY